MERNGALRRRPARRCLRPAERTRPVEPAVRLGLAECGRFRCCSTEKRFAPASRRVGRGRQRGHHRRGTPRAMGEAEESTRRRSRKDAASGPGSLDREQTPLCGFCHNGMMIKATELLEEQSETGAEKSRRIHDIGSFGSSVPVRQLPGDCRGGAARIGADGSGRRQNEEPFDVGKNERHGAELSRRGFFKAGGALVVGFGFCGKIRARRDRREHAGRFTARSWLEIHADNTVTIRTGKCDFGQGSVYTAYRQIIADELDVPLEAIIRLSPATPIDSRWQRHVRTAGARHDQSPQGRRLHAPRDAGTGVAALRCGERPAFHRLRRDHCHRRRRQRMTYGELVKDQNLKLTIPVTGTDQHVRAGGDGRAGDEAGEQL